MAFELGSLLPLGNNAGIYKAIIGVSPHWDLLPKVYQFVFILFIYLFSRRY